jgi:uncharacterized protein (TIGR02145 family)
LDLLLGGECDTDAHPRWDNFRIGTNYSTNEFGFSALPAGLREIPSEVYWADFDEIGEIGGWWSSIEQSLHLGKNHHLSSSINQMHLRNVSKRYGLSVRCVRDT